MLSVPITIFLGLLAVALTAYFQTRHWYRSTKEEIRVRETKDCTALIEQIAKVFDERITAQRRFLFRTSEKDNKRDLYITEVDKYLASLNIIRAKLNYYFSYEMVIKLEREIHEPLIKNANLIEDVQRTNRPKAAQQKQQLHRELSVISHDVYKLCAELHSRVAREAFGELRKINNWKDVGNRFVTSGDLVRRLLRH